MKKEMGFNITSTREVFNPVCYHIDEERKVLSTGCLIDHLKQHLARVQHIFLLDNGKTVRSRPNA
jgi:hypothetical protein